MVSLEEGFDGEESSCCTDRFWEDHAGGNIGEGVEMGEKLTNG